MKIKDLRKYMTENHDIPKRLNWLQFLKSLDFIKVRKNMIFFKTPKQTQKEVLDSIPNKVYLKKDIAVVESTMIFLFEITTIRIDDECQYTILRL